MRVNVCEVSLLFFVYFLFFLPLSPSSSGGLLASSSYVRLMCRPGASGHFIATPLDYNLGDVTGTGADDFDLYGDFPDLTGLDGIGGIGAQLDG